MNTRSLVLTLAVAAVGAGCAAPERSRNLNDPSIAPRTMAEQVCSTCHGIDGNAVLPVFPRLAGQVPDYTVGQLKAFRGHSRSDPAGFEYMWGLSRHLTDAQIEGLAGQHADYLVKQLGVFQRTDERPEGAVTKVIAHQLTEANIEAVSAYLQTVPPRQAGMARDPRDAPAESRPP
ncbi:MAG: c-type cytochrome [Betaproteobacteria bacterium]|nr:c-type cytochrome [Betaproteobacteria bacterium]